MQRRPSSSIRHVRFILAVALALLSLGGLAWSQGYVTFDIHGTSNPNGGNCAGTADCQAFQGSIYVPIANPTVTTTYNFGLGAANAQSGGFYLVLNSGFTDMISSTTANYCCSTTESDAVNFGLGNPAGAPNNPGYRPIAGTLTYTAGQGWWVSSVSFGFQNSGGSYWLEGTTSGPTAGGNFDVHAATRNGDGTYDSPTAGTGTTIYSAGLKTECMTPGQVGNNYCATLSADPVLNPEINGEGLPKVVLLLGSVYVVRRYYKSVGTADSPAVRPAEELSL